MPKKMIASGGSLGPAQSLPLSPSRRAMACQRLACAMCVPHCLPACGIRVAFVDRHATFCCSHILHVQCADKSNVAPTLPLSFEHAAKRSTCVACRRPHGRRCLVTVQRLR